MILALRQYWFVALAYAAGSWPSQHLSPVGAYRAPLTPADDTLKNRTPESGSPAAYLALGAVIPGYLSDRGLPPQEGRFTLTDSGLVFQASDGAVTSFPLIGPLRRDGARQWRVPMISLAYMDRANGRPTYLFRIDAGVFETETPGPLLDVASHPDWLDSLAPREGRVDRPLVDAKDTAGVWRMTRKIAASAYADTLYSLFGQPRAAIGLIGGRGRRAGRLGEYISARDSLALDPGRMSGEAQLRHAMAHELGHRWQARAPGQVETLWWGITPIRDPRRYGFGDQSEHQAEAIAFAINFLQTTARLTQPASTALALLDHYELLVPGTRTMVRYFSLQPVYRRHPLRSLLTTGR
ncbi:MAG TPA: hypothetical protein VFH40_08100 [Gemmatimonadales bacterium]|nr:hypothetical protein [Gemmatimonadales bacterium]